MGKLTTALKVFFVFAVLLGIIYPLAMTGISSFLMSDKANGSLLKKDGKIVGSRLIAQEFKGAAYFHSRYSFVNYDASNSGASNLAPSNEKLLILVKDRIVKIREENNLLSNISLPADMILSSASGLDPHISLENALLQMPRVAVKRGFSQKKVRDLINKNIEPSFVGIWGRDGVNVLMLNLALDLEMKNTVYK